MKFECGLIRDLLPLYQDDVVSKESRAVVDEHLAECAECREYSKRIMIKEQELAASIFHNNTTGYSALAKKLRLRKLIWMICIVLFIVSVLFGAFSYAIGKRLDPLQAAQTSQWIDDKSIFLSDVEFHPYKVFMYENEDKYRTILTRFNFPFWGAFGDSWANKTQDLVKLVGWCSVSDGANGITVVPIQSFDDRVAYVEMGSGADFVRKDAKPGDVVVFAWGKGIPWNDLNAVAYSADGQPLYRLGYEIVNSTVHVDELRWLPVE